MIARRVLGRSGVELSELGFGAGPLGGFYGHVDVDEAVRTVRAAWEEGVRYFDVAPLYGYGRAELLLGHVLRELPRDEFVLSTKVGRLLRPIGRQESVQDLRAGGLPFRPVVDYSRDGALRSLEESLLRLGVARADIVLIHDVDAHAQGSEAAAEAAFHAAMAGAYPALVELRRAGVVGAIGVGLNEVRWARRWIAEADLDCLMIAGRYTLLNREAEPELFPECQRRGIGVLAAGAFNGGLIAGSSQLFNYRPPAPVTLARLAELQREHGSDLRAAAIRFVLAHPAVTSLVSGAMRASEVRENARAIRP